MPFSFADGSQDTSTHSHETTFTVVLHWTIGLHLLFVLESQYHCLRSDGFSCVTKLLLPSGHLRPCRLADHSAHQSKAAMITPSIVLTIINCLQLLITLDITVTIALLSWGVEWKVWAKVSISNSRQCRLMAALRWHGMPCFPNQSIMVILGQRFSDFASLKNGWTLVM